MTFQRLSQAFFSVLLFASSLGKLFDMPGFYGIVQSYQLLPAVLVPFAAWSLAITELSICILLATRNMSTQNLIARSWVKHTIQLLIALHVFFLLGLPLGALLAGALFVFFGYRYANRNKQFMPGGMLAVVSLVVMLLLMWLSIGVA